LSLFLSFLHLENLEVIKNKKPLNPPIQGFGNRFMGTGLFKIFLGKLLLPYAFDSLRKVSDL